MFFQCRILLSPCPPHFLVPWMRFTAPKHMRFSSVPSLLLTQNSCWGFQQIHTCTSHITAVCSQCIPRTFLVAHGHTASPALPFQVPASPHTGAASSSANGPSAAGPWPAVFCCNFAGDKQVCWPPGPPAGA